MRNGGLEAAPLWSCEVTASRMGLISPLFSNPGVLRYRVDFQGLEYQGDDDEFFDLDDY